MFCVALSGVEFRECLTIFSVLKVVQEIAFGLCLECNKWRGATILIYKYASKSGGYIVIKAGT
ncbi:hypothetical protein [Pseudomonas sp. GM102]|uniref:hypothetical protein n=1 Tax=Pseudomonas sp. GM102 TaxID=1144321 RepID=UPI0012F9D9D3|nr:hypothetical protein [Pseudomonas sp. GM102]